MKDRFTLALLAIVAFVGGLLAMVVIARWQTGETATPPASSDVARAVPGVEPEIAADPPPERRSVEETSPEPARIPEEVGSVVAERSRTAERSGQADARRVPSISGDTAGREAPVRGGAPGSTRPQADRRGSMPEPRLPDRDASAPPTGSTRSPGADAGRAGGTKSSAGALPSDREILIGTPVAGAGRPLGRQPAPGSATTPASDVGATEEGDPPVPDDPPDANPAEPEDPFDDPPDDPTRPDDDPPDDPDPEPEPEIPPALVQAYTATPVFGVDDVVPVVVAIQSGTDVGHAPFHLAFDPRVLRFEGGEEGDFLRIDGAPTIFYATTANTGDEVVVGLSRLGSVPGIDGSGTLCVLDFVAIAPGTSPLRFKQAAVKDSGNARMDSSFLAAPVTVVANP